MNLNECKGSFLFKSPSSFLHSFTPAATQQNWKYLHIRNRQYTGFTSQIFGVVGPLGENLEKPKKYTLFWSQETMQNYVSYRIVSYRIVLYWRQRPYLCFTYLIK